MCGIIGYVGYREAAPLLYQGLKRLEYRGYDSAGVAVAGNGDGIVLRRSVGKLENLDHVLHVDPVHGTIGLGHTRWATHGRPSEENAHPHRAGGVVVIHNGIIENYLELRHELLEKGRTFSSETDTEVISHLIDQYIQDGFPFAEATRAALKRLTGSFAIVALSESQPDTILTAKSSTPIVVGLGENENFIASDVPALLDYTRQVVFLDDREMAEVTRQSVRFCNFDGQPIQRAPRQVTWDAVTAQKEGYKTLPAQRNQRTAAGHYRYHAGPYSGRGWQCFPGRTRGPQRSPGRNQTDYSAGVWDRVACLFNWQVFSGRTSAYPDRSGLWQRVPLPKPTY